MVIKMFIVVNPVSANGLTAKEWPEYEALLREAGYNFEVAYTEYPNHGTEITRQALKKGYKTIVSVGGDGTMNEVANGFFENGALIDEDARLVVFSRGTGCDFIRTLGINKGIDDLLSVLKRNIVKKIDVGVSEFVGYDGMNKIRYFLNESDIGIGGETTNRVNKRSKVLKGFLSFLIGAFIALINYKNKYFEIVIDDTIEIKGMMNSVVIANGKYFGGGMKVAPEASMTDGVFDIVIIGDINKFEFIKSFPLIYSGKHLKHPKLKLYKGKRVKVHCREKALFEVDGEQPGTADAQYEILPAAMNILV
jgi:YegS/Rv2252/BmrU family lipid kinase